MRFAVRVIDAQQVVSTLDVDASDEASARREVVARGFAVLSLSAISGQGKVLSGTRAGLSANLFVEELLALLEAGLNLTEALEAQLEHAQTANARTTLAGILARLNEGWRLSQALRDQPEIFGPLLVGVVQAAEGTSDLPRALARYLDYEMRVDSVRNKVVSAAIYPAILLMVGGGVALFLVGYVVPRFATVYRGSGRELPWASQLLLTWGEFASSNPWLVASAGIAVLGMAAAWVRWRWQQSGVLGVMRVLPGASLRIEAFELSRLYMTLGMLLEGGIPLHQALGLASPVMTSDRQPGLRTVSELIESGVPLSQALEQAKLSTPMALRLIRVGEKSGRLGEMLTRTANFYDKENARWIERFTKSFEPLLMAAIGVVVGVIVMLLYMPIFDLAGSLQP